MVSHRGPQTEPSLPRYLNLSLVLLRTSRFGAMGFNQDEFERFVVTGTLPERLTAHRPPTPVDCSYWPAS